MAETLDDFFSGFELEEFDRDTYPNDSDSINTNSSVIGNFKFEGISGIEAEKLQNEILNHINAICRLEITNLLPSSLLINSPLREDANDGFRLMICLINCCQQKSEKFYENLKRSYISTMIYEATKNDSISSSLNYFSDDNDVTDSWKVNSLIKLAIYKIPDKYDCLSINELGIYDFLQDFLTYAISGDIKTIIKLILFCANKISKICSFIPNDNERKENSYSNKTQSSTEKLCLLHMAIQLQYIVGIVNNSLFHFFQQSEGKYEDFMFLSDELCDELSKLMGKHLLNLVQHNRFIIPLMSMSVRKCLFFACLGSNYDIIDIILETPPGVAPFSSNSEKTSTKINLNQYVQILMDRKPNSDDKTEINNDKKILNEEEDLALSDPGYKYIWKMNREDSNNLLMKKTPGSFMIRPKEETEGELPYGETQFFLSFRALGDEGVKHAVVRRELKSSSTSSSTSSNEGGESSAHVFVYKCGKIGPCDSLLSLLQKISGILSVPLNLSKISKSTETSNKMTKTQLFNNLRNFDLNSELWEKILFYIKTNGHLFLNIKETTWVQLLSHSIYEKDQTKERLSDELNLATSPSKSSEEKLPRKIKIIEDYFCKSSEYNNELLNESGSKETHVFIKLLKSVKLSENKDLKEIVEKKSKMNNRWEDINSSLEKEEKLFLQHRPKELIWTSAYNIKSLCNTIKIALDSTLIRAFLAQETAANPSGSISSFGSVIDHLFGSDSCQPLNKTFLLSLAETLQDSAGFVAPELKTRFENVETWQISHSYGENPSCFPSLPLYCLLTAPIIKALTSVEGSLQAYLTPPFPASKWFLTPPPPFPGTPMKHLWEDPLLKVNPRWVDKHILNITNSLRDEQLLLAEQLVLLFSRYLEVHQVKFSGSGNGFGGAFFFADGCFERQEMLDLLIRWRTISVQHEKLVDMVIGSADYIEKSSPGGGITPETTGGSEWGDNTLSGSSQRLNDSPVGSEQTEGGNPYFELESSAVKRKAPWNSPLSISFAVYKLLSKIATLMKLPALTTTVSYSTLTNQPLTEKSTTAAGTTSEDQKHVIRQDAERYIDWLLSLKVLNRTTKPSENVFTHAHIYYRYIDPWEIRAVHDYALVRERTRLARHVYGAEDASTSSTAALGSVSTPSEGSSGTNSVGTATSPRSLTAQIPYILRVVLEGMNSYKGKTRVEKKEVSGDSLEEVEQRSGWIEGEKISPPHQHASFLKLWQNFRVEEYLLQTVADLHPGNDRTAWPLNPPKAPGDMSRSDQTAAVPLFTPRKSATIDEEEASTIAALAAAQHSRDSPVQHPDMPVLQVNEMKTPTKGKSALKRGKGESNNADYEASKSHSVSIKMAPHSPYIDSLNTHLLRNALLGRLRLPHRYVPIVQVDIYGIKEILALSKQTQKGIGPAAPIARSSSATNLPSTGIGNNYTNSANFGEKLNRATSRGTLSPSGGSHSTTLDVFSVVRCVKQSTRTLKDGVILNGKNSTDGSIITNVHKAEAQRSSLHSAQDSQGIAAKSNGNNNTSNNSNNNNSNKSSKLLSKIGKSVDYAWREQALFRFPLPEGLLTLSKDPDDFQQFLSEAAPSFPPVGLTRKAAGAGGPGGEGKQGTVASSAGVAGVTAGNDFPLSGIYNKSYSSSPADQGNKGNKKQSGGLSNGPVVVPLLEPPSVLMLSLFERTFFSDSKMGEVEIDLNDLSEHSVLKDWFPLVNHGTTSWLVYLQVKIRFQLLVVDNNHHDSNYDKDEVTNKNNINTSVSNTGKMLAQMDDFY